MRSVGACALFFPFRVRCMSCTEGVCYIKSCQHTKSISKNSKQTPTPKNHNKNHLCKCLYSVGAALGLLANCPQQTQVWVPQFKSNAKHSIFPSGSPSREQRLSLSPDSHSSVAVQSISCLSSGPSPAGAAVPSSMSEYPSFLQFFCIFLHQLFLFI